MILDPGLNLTLRPMKYPELYKEYKAALSNHWMVEEVNWQQDIVDIRDKLTDSQRHMVSRVVAFFATGDNIVAHNLVLNLYKHVNSPEARMYYGRQLAEEMIHVDFYKQMLEYYIPDPIEQQAAFDAIENIPSIKKKADFCFKWIDSLTAMDRIVTKADRKKFLMGLICFAAAIEGLFFMGAFAYVYYLRSIGLLPGLAEGTNWVFRDESGHMEVAFKIVDIVRSEEPDLFDAEFEVAVWEMLDEAIDCEMQFGEDALQFGVLGFTKDDMQEFLRYCADSRAIRLGMKPKYSCKNPLAFMVLQDVAPLTNFFEKRVTEYKIGLEGEMDFDEDF